MSKSNEQFGVSIETPLKQQDQITLIVDYHADGDKKSCLALKRFIVSGIDDEEPIQAKISEREALQLVLMHISARLGDVMAVEEMVKPGLVLQA